MKKLLLISALAILPIISFGAISIQEKANGGTLATSNNVYTAGASVNILEKKMGDVYAAGNMVSITADVEQDVFAVAGNINLTSKVGGDVRGAAGNMNISGTVNGELMIAGGQIEIAPSAVINGDFLAAAGIINIEGSVNGNAKIGADEVSISGALNKDIDITAKKLTIESGAVINGNINYHGEKEAEVKDGAKVNGKIDFTKLETPKTAKAGVAAVFTVAWLIKILITLVTTLIMFFLLKQNIAKISAEAVDKFWKRLLLGFILLVILPITSILLLITIFGSIVGVLGIALYVLLLILACIFSGIVFAELLNRFVFRKSDKALSWQMVVLGVIVMEVLTFVPIFGWIIRFAVFLAALGVISNLLFNNTKTLAE